MVNENSHITDQELLLAADGELPTRRAAEIHAHLSSCWPCRARMAEVEATIVDFVRAHRQALDPQLPSIAGPRALLRAHLSQLSRSARNESVATYRSFQVWTACCGISLFGVTHCCGGSGCCVWTGSSLSCQLARCHFRECFIGAWNYSGSKTHPRRHPGSIHARRLFDGP